MKIINTESWAGLEFSYAPGEVVELPDETALARIEAGLALAAEPPTEEPKPAKKK
jgi:hypothetical protein